MQVLAQVYVSSNALKEKKIQTSSNGSDPNPEDRVFTEDAKGNTLQLDAGVVYTLMSALAQARGLDMVQYLSKYKVRIE
jgi:hypothetical protein